MEIELKQADFIIIASAHNPSIIAPEWLKANSLIAEEPKHFVHTPDFSLFESESFVLMVDHQRMRIIVKKQDTKSLSSLAGIAKKYVELLPHIPYEALGLNFVWTGKIGDGEMPSKIELNINNSDLSSIFQGHEITFGGIIYAKKQPYRLKLTIEQQEEENILIHNFNYHHELKGLDTEDIMRIVESFTTLWEHSSKIVKGLYSREQKNECKH